MKTDIDFSISVVRIPPGMVMHVAALKRQLCGVVSTDRCNTCLETFCGCFVTFCLLLMELQLKKFDGRLQKPKLEFATIPKIGWPQHGFNRSHVAPRQKVDHSQATLTVSPVDVCQGAGVVQSVRFVMPGA